MAQTLRLLFSYPEESNVFMINCLYMYLLIIIRPITVLLLGEADMSIVLLARLAAFYVSSGLSNALCFHSAGNNWRCSPCAPTRSSRKRRTARQTTPLESRLPLNVSARPRPLPCLPWGPPTWKVWPAGPHVNTRSCVKWNHMTYLNIWLI